jgi:Ala-tRNA(Pro) deacylase
VQLLDQEKCSEEFPDCETGAIPPFGELYNLPVFLDGALVEDAEIIFGAGTLSESVRMSNADFIRIVKPQICSFAVESSDDSTLRKPHA